MAAVSYTLEIGGRTAPPGLLAEIQRLEVEEHAAMASMARITMATTVAAGGGAWTILDERHFPPLGQVRVSIAAGAGKPVAVIDARVVEARASLSDEPGDSSYEVVAADPTVSMNLVEKVRAWPNMADSDIATRIFRDHGLTPVVERTQPSRSRSDVVPTQRGTDMRFLRHLARRNGYEVYAVPGSRGVEGHFHPPRLGGSPQGVLNVNFGSVTNVHDFTLTHDMLGPATATAAGVDAGSLAVHRAAARSAAVRSLGKTALLDGGSARAVMLSRTGVAGTAELQAYAQASVDRSVWAIRAEGWLDTLAYGGVLRVRRPVLVRGAGRAHSGAYYVRKVLHEFSDAGYSCRFTLERNAFGVTAQDDFRSGAQAS